jgi:type II secretory pathway pseudopilin PulG
MKTPSSSSKRAFSLMETVIAIGVLAVLLTGFMVVFAPAAAGIKKSINAQEADRLTSTLEQELVTWRTGNPGTTGFQKAFEWLKSSNTANDALLVYQYRGSLSSNRTEDGTPAPVVDATGKRPGVDYAVVSMVRRKSDTLFTADMQALEGGVYLAKCKQLVFDSTGQLIPGTEGQIKNPKPNTTPPDPAYQAGPFTNPDLYPEAVIAFSAEFYSLPGKRAGYFDSAFAANFAKFKNPVFTRNLAVRR